MQNYFKDVLENGTVKEVCDIVKTTLSNNVSPIHMVAIQNLSTFVCPVYGDFYSFPWKRGPHDNILEYIEASKYFDNLRQSIYLELRSSDFVSKSMIILMKEDESKNVEVKISVLRLFI